MAKRIMIGNSFYRMRRGKLVEIPPEWLGKTVHPQTMRKRKKAAQTSRSPKPVRSHGVQM